MITDALSLKKIASYSLSAGAMMCRRRYESAHKRVKLPMMMSEIERSVRDRKTDQNAAGIAPTTALIRRDSQGQAGNKAVAVSIFFRRMPAYVAACERDVISLSLLSMFPCVMINSISWGCWRTQIEYNIR